VTISNHRLRALIASAFVLLLVLVTALWRLSLIQLGPDADSDAYGHHLAARHLFVDASNQAVHWVWLPLFHWLQLPVLAAGGSIQWVRTLNVGVWALVPLVLMGLLAWPRSVRHGGPTARSVDWITAASAAAILALCPLGMQLGTTAQPEPLFTLLLVGFAWAQERRRRGVAALLLSALVLLRYEAWAVLIGSAALIIAQALLRARKQARDGNQRRSWLARLARDGMVVALPFVAILVWAAVRAPFDGGRYFAFLTDTHDFARHAIGEPAPSSALETLRALVHYPLFVAARTFGVGIVLVPFGVARLLREQRWLLLSGTCVLGFITLGHATHATLGLERHFVAVLPLYAALMACGARSLAGSIEKALERQPRLHGLADSATRAALQIALGGALLLSVYDRAVPWLRHWSVDIATRFEAEAELARALDGVPERARIFCDNPIVEGLVRFRGDHVERGKLDDAAFRSRVLAAASDAEVYVGAPSEHLAVAALPGKIIFRAQRDATKPATPWDGHGDLVVLRVSAEP
jgi:hypothetical protein